MNGGAILFLGLQSANLELLFKIATLLVVEVDKECRYIEVVDMCLVDVRMREEEEEDQGEEECKDRRSNEE